MSRESLDSHGRDEWERWADNIAGSGGDPTAEGRLIVDFPGLYQALRNNCKTLRKMQKLPNNTKMFQKYTNAPPNSAKMLWR